jgi:hypothetical protein
LPLKLRLVSILLLVSFSFQQFSYAADLKPQEFNLFQKPQVHIKFPESVATVEDAWFSEESLRQNSGGQKINQPRLIYLLQDAHTNESGQINLSKTLDIILEKE